MRFFLFIVFFLLTPCFVSALEADQYQIWKNGPLADSTKQVNQFLNQELQVFLDRYPNKNRPYPAQSKGDSKHYNYRLDYYSTKNTWLCEDVSRAFMHYIRPHFFKNRLSRYVVKDPEIEVLPKKKKLIKDLKKSIYHGMGWPFLMPVSQTLQINGVYLGTDKLSHFFSSGRRYYKRFLNAKKEGLSDEEALKRAIYFGTRVSEEKGWLGLWTSGAFSYADLESNYQGMRLAIEMCTPKNSVLKLNKERKWKVQRPLDMRNYVNPLWDESYNNSYYSRYRFKAIKKNLEREYCEEGKKAFPQKLWSHYKRNLKGNFNFEYLKSLLNDKKIPDPRYQSISAVCEFPKNFMVGPYGPAPVIDSHAQKR